MNERLIKALSEIYDLCRIPSVGALKCIEIRAQVKVIARKALQVAGTPTAEKPILLEERKEPAMTLLDDHQFYSEYED